MAKGKWAQGIQPRAFQWVIQDQLAICERPGGYGSEHRKVRRQEEVIWIRENGFSFVISLIPSDHNLHAYNEHGMPWRHWPFGPGLDLQLALPQMYTELQKLLAANRKILLHMEEVGDRLAGVIAGYLRWTEMVPVTHEAIIVGERLFGRQMGPDGRAIVNAAAEAPKVVPEPRPADKRRAGAGIDAEIDVDAGPDINVGAAAPDDAPEPGIRAMADRRSPSP